ncbi:MAG: hypothetical protein GY718_09620 [Lentisphaerae bacterium]|nr:hypothetical protein [Lentisphaerota bacterium]
MNKERLFEYLESKDRADLIGLLSSAFDTMDTNQRHDVFGKIIKDIPPSHVVGEELLSDIEVFYKSSMAGHYYAPFDINSKNFWCCLKSCYNSNFNST